VKLPVVHALNAALVAAGGTPRNWPRAFSNWADALDDQENATRQKARAVCPCTARVKPLWVAAE
jgi:hypothetical protein